MEVIVRGRQEGKSTELVRWLICGMPLEKYPYWSRAIVCCDQQQVKAVRRMVDLATLTWNRIERSALQAAVWGLLQLQESTLGHNLKEVEFAIDDFDLLMSYSLRVPYTPSIVTMTGELWSPSLPLIPDPDPDLP